ncbi:mechanosensitive ion channel family protein [Archangium primigenium]|uniref:mechanosensitive ion channel family protein n=1 Tax=[Archangium] primigenium TaxID=2792470 RepID=UPI00195DC277|nr:mechanosensitive ion channel family protein [Archangium primigenium]MBM7119457.1 mechanosensitive ion channel family protein [Archangium primigenium]
MLRKLAVVLSLCMPAMGWAFNEGLGDPPSQVERQTPTLAVGGFLEAAHARDLQALPHYLSLSHLPAEQQRAEGERLGRRLMFVMDRTLWLDFTHISQQPDGGAPGTESVTLGQVPLGRGMRDIRLRRVVGADGAAAWVFSEKTVRAVDALFEEHGSPLVERLPTWLFVRPVWVLELWQWLGLGVLLAAALLVSRGVEGVARRLAERATKLTKSGWDDQVLAASQGPLRYVLLAMLATAGSRLLAMPPPAQHALDLGARSLMLVSAAWFVLRFVRLSASFIEEKVITGAGADVGRARGLRTQLVVMRRIIEAATYVISASLLLLQFEGVRSVGVSLLASAGLAGLVIGLAAQKSISTLLAGIQLSITQPVRIGDTVIVENEWGWIEEITLTYVVVKVWDLRRLVVPMTHFLEKPFQNWSKVSPDILGTAEVYADFRTDVPGVRQELSRVLREDGQHLWDGKVEGLLVTALSERTMTLRALVSASDSGKAFELRCIVREKLVEYLGRQPHGLPVVRAEGLVPAEAVGSRTAPVLPSTGGRNVVVPGARGD